MPRKEGLLPIGGCVFKKGDGNGEAQAAVGAKAAITLLSCKRVSVV